MIVIPYVGNLSDRIGRRPPIIVGALASGPLSFAYLYAISIENVPLAIVMSLLMWGVVYQGYNAVFPSFYPELFPTRTRVTAMAIAQNIGTTITALLPALFATVAPPGSANIPLQIGAITFAVTIIAAARSLERAGDLSDPPQRPWRPQRGSGRQTGLRQNAGRNLSGRKIGRRTRMNNHRRRPMTTGPTKVSRIVFKSASGLKQQKGDRPMSRLAPKWQWPLFGQT